MKYQNFSRLTKLFVLAHFLSDYHSGQWSRGYRYLSITLRRLRESDLHHPLDWKLSSSEKRLYRHLVNKYADKV
jgi:hypothetical protein